MTEKYSPGRTRRLFILLTLITILLFAITIGVGPVYIPLEHILGSFTRSNDVPEEYRYIILQARMPYACSAFFCGASLSVAGLMMQTLFRNPLAGPSILGVTSGASLGVALLTLALPASLSGSQYSLILGSVIGAAGVILLISGLSIYLKNGLVLLIAGIMISYLCSACVSLLNFFAPAEDVKSFVVWGLGSFSGVSSEYLPLFTILTVTLLFSSLLVPKPLDALLLGERYSANMGYSINTTRTIILTVAGLLTAVATAYCGPVGFIGLVTPHVCRIIFRTSSHGVLLPASALTGSAAGLACGICCILPLNSGMIPVNAITPIFGVPVIFYLLLKRNKLPYFN